MRLDNVKRQTSSVKREKTISCPICGKDVKFYEKEKFPPNFPFCSRRCKLIDLGNWLNEEYRISEPLPGANTQIDEES